MSNQITGTRIYHFDNIEVFQHADGYIITDGIKLQVQKDMPCLNANVLRVLLSDEADPFERFQVNKYGNILPVAKNKQEAVHRAPFDVWFERESELRELDMMGY